MGGEVIESREDPESEEEERRMEWNTTWENPLTSYVKHFVGLIGDQRTRKTFGEIVKGIIGAGSLICQQIAGQSAELSQGKKGAQRVIRLATGESTQRSELDAEHLTERLREVAVQQLEQAPEDEVWLIADSSDLRKPWEIPPGDPSGSTSLPAVLRILLGAIRVSIRSRASPASSICGAIVPRFARRFPSLLTSCSLQVPLRLV
jgi:hypothetical protein